MKNKVVLITGSSQGFGKALASVLAKEGANVIITYNSNKKSGHNIALECSKFNPSLLLKLDVRDNISIEKCIDQVMKTFGKIDILINNAGILILKPLHEQTIKNIEDQLNVNLGGLIKVTKAVLPYMKKGIIINISSGAGVKGHKDATLYSSTKAGVIRFTESLSKELPDKIKVYSLNLGKTKTQMSNFVGNEPEDIAKILRDVLIGKIEINSGDNLDLWRYLDKKGVNK